MGRYQIHEYKYLMILNTDTNWYFYWLYKVSNWYRPITDTYRNYIIKILLYFTLIDIFLIKHSMKNLKKFLY